MTSWSVYSVLWSEPEGTSVRLQPPLSHPCADSEEAAQWPLRSNEKNLFLGWNFPVQKLNFTVYCTAYSCRPVTFRSQSKCQIFVKYLSTNTQKLRSGKNSKTICFEAQQLLWHNDPLPRHSIVTSDHKNWSWSPPHVKFLVSFASCEVQKFLAQA